MLRLPDGMRDHIRESADANGRSMNAEIVARLQASFDRLDGVVAIGQREVAELSDRIAKLLEALGK